MKTLTFAFDVQLNDKEDWIMEGTKVEVAEASRLHEGFTPVIITEACRYDGKIFKTTVIEYFLNESFVEFRN
jgi:hypothetical protein